MVQRRQHSHLTKRFPQTFPSNASPWCLLVFLFGYTYSYTHKADSMLAGIKERSSYVTEPQEVLFTSSFNACSHFPLKTLDGTGF